jgi:hypothetical protein
MPKRAMICAALAFAIPAQASAESWLCIADLSSGLIYRQGLNKWQTAVFDTEGKRFIIKPAVDSSQKYEVNEFGSTSKFPMAFCENGPNEYGYLFCKGLFSEFKFNTINQRYIRTYVAGYVEVVGGNDVKEGGDTPFIEIGKCSKI